jgi:AAA15 family ATPase/GTPase
VVKELNIRNFKSIKDLQLDCKRVNLFIGEPNVGKSNILEALGLFAFPCCHNVKSLTRINDLSNLFFENDITHQISIATEILDCKITFDRTSETINFAYSVDGKLDGELSLPLSHHWTKNGLTSDFGIHPYFYKTVDRFDKKSFNFLNPPHGDNLFAILHTNPDIRSIFVDFLEERGLKLNLKPVNSEIEIAKEHGGILTSHPYQVVSDTLQRILFYVTAIESNSAGTSLIFEEPESHIFPYYTKYLAEKIAYSDDKQYFITTHNPYFLQSLLQKTPLGDLQVNLVYMKNFQTRVRPISVKEEVEELIDLESNVFLNLDKFLSE